MTADVVTLSAVSEPNPPDAEVIETLERLLVKARSGELRAFAYAIVVTDRCTASGWTSTSYGHELMSSICTLQYRFVKDRYEGSFEAEEGNEPA